jgi:hypothetical protein
MYGLYSSAIIVLFLRYPNSLFLVNIVLYYTVKILHLLTENYEYFYTSMHKWYV